MATKPTYSELERQTKLLEKAAGVEWMQMAVNASGDAIGISTINGHHFFQNKSFRRMFGYTQEELYSLNLRVLFADNDAATEVYKTIMSGNSWHGELELVAKDGHHLPGLVRVDSIKGPEGEILGMIGVFTDITDRKQAIEALRQSEKKFKAMSDQSLLGVEILQGDSIKYVNQAYCDLSGYSRDEILNWKPGEYAKIIHPDHLDFVLEQAKKKQAGSGHTITQYQFKALTKGGETKWIELYSKTILYEGEKADLVLFIDITERKLAEEALLESEERFRCFATAAFDAVLLHQDGILISANDQYFGMFGYEPGELVGKEVISLTVAPEAVEFVWKQISSGATGPYETIGFRKDGTRFPIELRAREWQYKGNRVRVVAIMDTTEHKRAAEMLRHYNKRLRVLHQIDRDILVARSPEAIVNTVLGHIRGLVSCHMAGVGLYDHDTNELVIMDSEANGGDVLNSGTRIAVPGDWMNCMLTERCHIVNDLDEYSAQVSPTVRLILSEGIRSYLTIALVVEEKLIGELILASKASSHFSTEDIEITGEIANQLAIAIQQARMKEQIERHTAELEERVAQRTAELQNINTELQSFTYSVSHDLKAPLRGIDGYCRLLLQDYVDRLDEEGQFFLHTIRNATQQMNQLIEDLLAYSRLERRSMRTRKLDPGSLVETAIAERANELQESGVKISVDIPCVEVLAEVEGLLEALRNLLENALKFTNGIDNPRIEIGGRESDKSCILWIRDNGIGFDMRYHDRIFEIFQRLHRAEDYPGTGIGLAIVRKVMQRMGGNVWGESTPGQGATFYLEVPK